MIYLKTHVRIRPECISFINNYTDIFDVIDKLEDLTSIYKKVSQNEISIFTKVIEQFGYRYFWDILFEILLFL